MSIVVLPLAVATEGEAAPVLNEADQTVAALLLLLDGIVPIDVQVQTQPQPIPEPIPLPTPLIFRSYPIYSSSTYVPSVARRQEEPKPITIKKKRIEKGLPGAVEAARIAAASASRDSIEEIIRDLATYAIMVSLMPETDAERVDVILEYTRSVMRYVPDPIGTDRFQAPRAIAQKINRGRIVAGDCADHVGLFASLVASIGIPVAVVLQTDVQPKPHVIAAVRIDGRWIPVDVVDRMKELGETPYQGREIWIPLPGSEEDGLPISGIDHISDDNVGRYIGVGAASADGTVALETTREIAVRRDNSGSGWIWGLAGLAVGGLVVWMIMRA